MPIRKKKNKLNWSTQGRAAFIWVVSLSLFFAGILVLEQSFRDVQAAQFLVDTDAEFNAGTLSSTTVKNTGTPAYLQAAPDTSGGTWYDTGWLYRKQLVVYNYNSNTQYEYQVFVDSSTIDLATIESESKVDTPGYTDIRFVAEDDTEVYDYWRQDDWADGSENTIGFWVKITTLTALSNTTFYMYYGSPGAAEGSNIENTFTYQSTRPVAYVVHRRMVGQSLNVISLRNNNTIVMGATTLNMDEQDTNTIPSGQVTSGATLYAKTLFEVTSGNNGTDMISPASFAGTEFIQEHGRGNGGSPTDEVDIDLYAPWASGIATVFDNGSPNAACNGCTVNGTVNQLNDTVDVNRTFRIVSNVPVLAYRSDDDRDANILPPTTFYFYDNPAVFYLYGFKSETAVVAAGPNGALVNADDSEGGTASNNLGANANGTVGGANQNDDYFGTRSWRWDSTNVFGANTYGDSDGADSVVMLPYIYMGTTFGSAVLTEFVAIVTPHDSATVDTYTPLGVPNDQDTTGSGQTVNYLGFGTFNNSTYENGGWKVEADKPVMMVWQDSQGDEKNAFTWPMMRQYVYPHPLLTSAGSEVALNFYRPAEYLSEVYDTGVEDVKFDQVIWSQNLQQGSDIQLHTRTGPTATPDASWSAWSASYTVTSGDSFESPVGRYLQVISTFTSSLSTTTAELFVYRVTYPPVLKTVSPTSVGINAGVLNSPYTFEFTGHNFSTATLGMSTTFFIAGSTNPDAEFTISSYTLLNSNTIQITLSVSSNSPSGLRDIRMDDPTRDLFSQSNLLSSSITVTVPLAEFISPAEPVDYSTGVAAITGTGFKKPVASPAPIDRPDIRVTCTANCPGGALDGYQWDPGQQKYVNPIVQKWFPVTVGTDSWQHTGWPNNDTAQPDGINVSISVRGTTEDSGVGIGTNTITFSVDKQAPTLVIVDPLVNDSKNSITTINGTGQDLGSGIVSLEMQLIDSGNNLFSDPANDDTYWTADSGTGFIVSATWFHLVRLDGAGDETSPFATAHQNIVWDLKPNPTTPELPTWIDGRKYRMQVRGQDNLVRVSTTLARDFYYDVSRPTLTVTNPATLGPTEPLGLGDPLNVWRSALDTIDGTMEDGVVDPVIGQRIIYYCIFEQGGTDIYGTGCAGGSPVYAQSAFTPNLQVAPFSINVSTNWQNGFWYNVKIYGTDRAGNTHGTALLPITSGYFVFDNNLPTSDIIPPTPTNGSSVNTLPILTGTADDPTAGPEMVQIRGRDNFGNWLSTTTVNFDQSSDPGWQDTSMTLFTTSATWERTDINFTSGNEYTMYFWARDKSGNFQNGWSTVTFRYDNEAPLTTITTPADQTYINDAADLPQIHWTSSDPGFSGVQQVRIRVRRLEDGGCWKIGVSTWNTTAPVVAACADYTDDSAYFATWSGGAEQQDTNFLNTNLTDGTSYQVFTRARDNAQNFQVQVESTTFFFDQTNPVSAITHPTANGRFNILPTISGTVTDPSPITPALGKIVKVEVQIERASDNARWDGTSWVSTVDINYPTTYRTSWQADTEGSPNFGPPAGGTFTWTYPNGTFQDANLESNLTDGIQYRVRSRAKDAAANVSANSADETFVWDTTEPDTWISLPNASPTNSIPTVSGTASDPAPGFLSQVRIAYRQVNGSSNGDEQWWNPATDMFDQTGTTPPEISLVTATLVSGTFDVQGSSIPTFANGIDYQIFAEATDAAGNQTSFPGLGTVTDRTAGGNATQAGTPGDYIYFLFQQPPPQSYIGAPIDQDHYMTSGSNNLDTLTGTATDADQVDVRIIDYGPDFVLDAGNDDQVWNGSGFVSTASFTGYVVVDNLTGGAIQNWDIDMTGNWLNDRRFRLIVRSTQSAIIEAQPFEDADFFMDATVPTAVIQKPGASYVNNLPTISGTSADVPSGQGQIQSAQVSISTGSGPLERYWTGTAWTGDSTPVFLTGQPLDGLFNSSSEVWYSSQTPTWSDGLTYRVEARLFDRAGRVVIEQQSFTFDVSSPTTRFVRPLNGNNIRNLPTISGTAVDNQANSRVQVAIEKRDGTGQTWWNQDILDFTTSGTPIWNLITSTVGFISSNATSYIYAPTNLNSKMTSGLDFTLLLRSVDVAGNIQDVFNVGDSSITITMDKNPPTSTITLPADSGSPGQGRYTPANLGQDNSGGGGTDDRFVGTQSDTGVGVSAVRIRLSYLISGDTYYWDGSQFSSTTVNETTAWQLTDASVWRYLTEINVSDWNTALDGNGHRSFLLESRAEDNTTDWDGAGPGNIQLVDAAATFIIDNSAPLVGISSPVATSLQALTQITGTADATLADLDQAQVRISTGSGPAYYWTGSSWTTNVTWLSTTKDSSSAWHYTVPPAMLTDTTYTAVARSLDYAGQFSTVYSTRIFTVDLTSPTVSITLPVSATTYSGVQTSTPIAGTAADPGTFATGLSTVQVSIYDVTDTDYFNGTIFAGGGPFFLGMTGGTLNNWQFDDGNLDLENDHQYQVTARTQDNAGNYTDSTVITFQYDVEIPTSAVTSITPGYVTSLTQITGTATDERFGARNFEALLGTDTVGVAVYEVESDRWFDGGTFNGANPLYDYTVTNNTTTTPNEWTYSFPPALSGNLIDGNSYRFVSRAFDKAGNAEFVTSTAPHNVGIAIIYDPTPPTINIVQPFDATPGDDDTPRISTVTAEVMSIATIKGTAVDGAGNPGNGVQTVDIRIWRSDPARYWTFGTDYDVTGYGYLESQSESAWFTAVGSNSFTNWYTTFTFLSDYKYHIEVRARDIAGTYSVTYATASFIMDQNAPTSGVTVPANATTINTLAQISGTMSESGTNYPGTVSPVKIAVRELGPPSYGRWWNDGSSTFSFTTPPTLDDATLFTSSWTYGGVTASDLTSGTSYYVTSRAQDNASPINDEGYSSPRSIEFTWDVDTATVGFITPGNPGLFFNNLTQITGTAQDSTSPTDLNVEISIKWETQNRWWEDADGDGGSTGAWGSVGVQHWVHVSTSAGDPQPWKYDFPNAQWTHASSYTVTGRVTDTPGNQSPVFGPVGFTFDTSVSTTGIVAPPIGGYFDTQAPKIIGTAEDLVSGVQTLEIAISSTAAGDPGSWWTGVSYTGASEVYVATTSYDFIVDPDSWTFIPSNLEDGKTYLVRRRITDNAGNIRSDEAAQFLFDSGVPTILIQDPEPSLDFVRSLPTVSGTADPNGGTLTQTEAAIQINPATSGNFWDPATQGFTILPADNARWKGTQGTAASWYLDGTSTPTWANNTEYQVYARTFDEANNPSLIVISSFTYDNQEPTSHVGRPIENLFYRQVTMLSGTASDNQQLSNVQIAIRRHDTTPFWYDGSNFITGGASPSYLPMTFLSSNATFWTYAPAGLDADMTGGLTYSMVTRAFDAAGSTQTVLGVPVSSRTFTVDKLSPESSITFPADDGDNQSGRYTPSNVGQTSPRFQANVVDSGYAANNAGVREAQMRLSYLLSGDTYYWTGTDFSSYTVTPETAYQPTSNSDPVFTYVASVINWIPALDGSGHRRFLIEFRGQDNARLDDGTDVGNIEVPGSPGVDSRNFIVDNSPPVVGIATPAVSAIQDLAIITGTADADLAGFDLAEIHISTGSGPAYYWTGSSWTTNLTWLSTTRDGGTGWHYTVPGAMVADTTYTVVARSLDYAGQYSTTLSTRVFTVDRTSPTINVTLPVNTNTYSGVQTSTPMAGTAADPGTFATGLSTVQVSLYDVTDADYFNGTIFAGGGPFFLGMTGGTLSNWQYNDGNLSLENDHQYQLTARAYDSAGNLTDSSVITFQYDVEIPTSTIASITPGYVTNLTQITGTATDERFGARNFEALLGTDTVGVAVYEVESDRWFDGGTFNGANPLYDYTVVNNTVPATNVWTYSFPPALSGNLLDGNSYRFVSRAFDLAGNPEFGASTAPHNVGITITYDPTPPTVDIVAPFDATPADDNTPRISTVTAEVFGIATIKGTTVDGAGNPGNGVQTVDIRIWRSDPARYWTYGTDYDITGYGYLESQADSAWFTAIGSNSFSNWYTTFTFLSDYKYHIEVRARDLAGTFSVTYATASFIMDQDVPTSGITVPVNATTINTLAQISGTMSESGTNYPGTVSPVKIAVREFGPPSYGRWWNDGSSTFSFTTPPTLDDATLFTSSWTYGGVTAADLTSGTSYYVTSRAQDNASPINDEGYSSPRSIEFTWDVDTATVGFITPGNPGLFFNNLTQITGTAQDSTSPTDLNVEISIKWETQNRWWEDADGDGGSAGAWGSVGVQHWVHVSTSAGDPQPWKYDFPNAQWTHASSYTVTGRVTDTPGNQSPVFGPVGFTFDTSVSTTGIVAPPIGGYFDTQAPKIIGTAEDLVSGVQTLEIAISSTAAGDPGSWWTGVSYTGASEVYVATTSYDFIVDPDSWTFIPSNLEDGKTYLVRRRITDNAGNIRSDEAAQFLFDSGVPTILIQAPEPSLDYVRSLPTVSGTADANGGTLTQTEAAIQINPATSGNFWDPATQGFTILPADNARWKGTQGTAASWYLDGTSTPTWANNTEYQVYARTFDEANNPSLVVISSFTFDNEEPVAHVGRPIENNFYRQVTMLSGTASDNQELSNLEIAIRKHDTTPFWYDGSNFVTGGASPSYLPMTFLSSNATFWTYAPSGFDADMVGGLTYSMVTRAFDTAGSTQTSLGVPTSSRTFTIDKLSPESSITFPADDGDNQSGRYTPSNVGQASNQFQATVVDNGYAANNAGVKLAQMRLSYLLSGDTYYWTGTDFSSFTVTPEQAFQPTADSNPTFTYVAANINWAPALDGSGHRRFLIEFRGQDNARLDDETLIGNIEVPGSPGVDSRNFIVDNSPPVVGIATPAVSAIQDLAIITGTADADLAGFDLAEIHISTGSGPAYYWTGSSWTTNLTWLSTTRDSGTGWHYTFQAPWSPIQPTRLWRARSITLDNTPQLFQLESSQLTQPAPQSMSPCREYQYVLRHSDLNAHGWNHRGSGHVCHRPSTVQVSLYDVTDADYFNGTIFAGGGPFFLGMTGGTLSNWQYNDGNLSLENDHQYQLTARLMIQPGTYRFISDYTPI